MGNKSSTKSHGQTHSKSNNNLDLEEALNKLQTMFNSVEREIIQVILMEKHEGNISMAVETLLTITEQGNYGCGTELVGLSQNVLYDDNMRPIVLDDSFLQPPSYYSSLFSGQLEAH
eukprot:261416_1